MVIRFSFWILCWWPWAIVMAQISKKPELDIRSMDSTRIWATQYYIPHFTSSGKIPFLLKNNVATGLYADTCDYCRAAMEGTVWVRDSVGKVVVLNFDSRDDSSIVDCRKCYRFAKSRLDIGKLGATRWQFVSGFGSGVKNYKLVPFCTIAVDPAFIPYGSVLYIPQVAGTIIKLEDGQTILHDGLFFAGDTGAGIKGNHVDVFTGLYARNPFPGVVLSNPEKTFMAYRVKDTKAIERITKLHMK